MILENGCKANSFSINFLIINGKNALMLVLPSKTKYKLSLKQENKSQMQGQNELSTLFITFVLGQRVQKPNLTNNFRLTPE